MSDIQRSESSEEKAANIKKAASILLLAHNKGALKKAVLSKPNSKTVVKAVFSSKMIGKEPMLQLETFTADNKALHKNISPDASADEIISNIISEYSQVNLITTEGECELRCSSSGKSVLLGADKLLRKLSGADIVKAVMAPNNRQKNRILDGSEPFLYHLGVSDEKGRVFDKKQAKFKQINRFLELIRDVEDKLPVGDIRICDLCCGKSYLSFAVYHYFANIKKYKVSMTGIDLKADVIEYCSQVSKKLSFDGLEFICGNINDYSTNRTPDLVISLHACDFATDIVLEKAADWGTGVILSTPCCHHEMNNALNSEILSFISKHSMLRQKLADAATDALRLMRLEAKGYTTSTLELIDPDETPKNIMLRAIKKKGFSADSPEAKRLYDEYLEAKRFLCGDDTEKYHF